MVTKTGEMNRKMSGASAAMEAWPREGMGGMECWSAGVLECWRGVTPEVPGQSVGTFDSFERRWRWAHTLTKSVIL
jgi:hypothetical protein